jgi:uncharacterized phage-associated protein
MLREFFDYSKAKEVVLYIVNRLSGSDNDTYHVVKAVFYADKFSLNEHGRTICGDMHAALEFGPVPSNIYNILKTVRRKTEDFSEDHELRTLISFHRNENNQESFRAIRDANMDFLSESDKRNLNLGIEMVKGKSFQELKDMTHTESAYISAWNKALEHGSQSEIIDRKEFISTLPEGEELLEYLGE